MSKLANETSTTSKRSLFPIETKNLWVVDAWESKLKLSNGRIMDDWVSALGASTLGYNAVPNFPFKPAASMPWKIEEEFANQFCEAMGTESVRWFKSGSDAVSCAVRLARAFTKRRKVLVFEQCYHGTGDWHGPNLWTKGGIVDHQGDLLIRQFGSWFKGYWGDIAAIVLEPVPKSILLPPEGWLQHLREVCDEHGILLISDEIILGYRHQLSGYLNTTDTSADLYCYGKAMGQGAAISATTGRQDIMKLLEKDVHFSGTNNGSPLELQIAQWTLNEYMEKDICTQLNWQGLELKLKLNNNGFETRGLNERFEVVFPDDEAKKSAVSYCFDHGILFPGFCSMAISHTVEQMERLLETLVKWRDQC